jgi:hypothetical protein
MDWQPRKGSNGINAGVVKRQVFMPEFPFRPAANLLIL